jgi:hypothetical protein
MKHEWKKHEKMIYLPKCQPEILKIPAFKYFTIKGRGNPNDQSFSDYIEVLYALSYAVRMSYRSDEPPKDYFEYTVYPLEGVWDLCEGSQIDENGKINKEDLIFTLMIRQPDFVTPEFADEIKKKVKAKKKLDLVDQVKFEVIEDGLCCQMLHKGSYDDEGISFNQMEDYSESKGSPRRKKQHREIYLTDFRKTKTEDLKTVLRFEVMSK